MPRIFDHIGEKDRLYVLEEDAETREPRVICSLGIRQG